MNLISIIARNT